MAKKPSEKHPHGRLRIRRQNNIKIDFRSKYMLQGWLSEGNVLVVDSGNTGFTALGYAVLF